MTWIIANWRIIAIGSAIIAVFFAGWHAHAIYDASKTQNAEVKTIKALGEGESKIIDFNQSFDKEKINAKNDKCVDAAIPAGLLKLQQQ